VSQILVSRCLLLTFLPICIFFKILYIYIYIVTRLFNLVQSCPLIKVGSISKQWEIKNARQIRDTLYSREIATTKMRIISFLPQEIWDNLFPKFHFIAFAITDTERDSHEMTLVRYSKPPVDPDYRSTLHFHDDTIKLPFRAWTCTDVLKSGRSRVYTCTRVHQSKCISGDQSPRDVVWWRSTGNREITRQPTAECPQCTLTYALLVMT